MTIIEGFGQVRGIHIITHLYKLTQKHNTNALVNYTKSILERIWHTVGISRYGGSNYFERTNV